MRKPEGPEQIDSCPQEGGQPVISQLADILGLDIGEIQECLEMINKDTAYRIKGRRGARIVSPQGKLRTLQQTISDKILSKYPLPPAAHGSVPGRNQLTNIQAHRENWQGFLMKMSILPCSPGTAPIKIEVDVRRIYEDDKSVKQELTRSRHSKIPPQQFQKLAEMLTKLSVCPHPDQPSEWILPQGSPTSAALTNILFDYVDEKFVKWLEREYPGAIYTRDVNDITVSFPENMPEEAQEKVIDIASQIFPLFGYSIDDKKTEYIDAKKDGFRVGGLMVVGGEICADEKNKDSLSRHTQIPRGPKGPKGQIDLRLWNDGRPEIHLLADILGLDIKEIQECLEMINKGTGYYAKDKPEATKVRRLNPPHGKLKDMQRTILDEVLSLYPLSEAAHGGVPGHSPLTNLLAHEGNWGGSMIKMDIRSCYPSTNLGKIRRMYEQVLNNKTIRQKAEKDKNIKIPAEQIPQLVEILAKLSAWPHPDHPSEWSLPQGAPTSVALINILFTPLDKAIAAWLDKTYPGAIYTRYVDDITISFQKSVPAKIQNEVIGMISQQLKIFDYQLNGKKTKYIDTKNGHFRVGGLMIVDKQIRVDKTNKDRFLRLAQDVRAQIAEVLKQGERKQTAMSSRQPVDQLPSLVGMLRYLNWYDQLRQQGRINEPLAEIDRIRREIRTTLSEALGVIMLDENGKVRANNLFLRQIKNEIRSLLNHIGISSIEASVVIRDWEQRHGRETTIHYRQLEKNHAGGQRTLPLVRFLETSKENQVVLTTVKAILKEKLLSKGYLTPTEADTIMGEIVSRAQLSVEKVKWALRQICEHGPVYTVMPVDSNIPLKLSNYLGIDGGQLDIFVFGGTPPASR